MNKFFLIALLIFSSESFAQVAETFDIFVKLFPKTVLPASINYQDSEFKIEFYNFEDTSNQNSVIPYKDHILPKDTSLIISYDLVKLFLLFDNESITPLFPNNIYATDTIFPTYYLSSQLITETNFLCLIYERQFVFNGIINSEKYLCTFKKNKKLADKILVASALYSGTGLLNEGYRVPWFPDVKSDIDKDLTIVIKNTNSLEIRYRINRRGRIKKVK